MAVGSPNIKAVLRLIALLSRGTSRCGSYEHLRDELKLKVS